MVRLLDFGVLKDERNACSITGLMPIHAVTACSLEGMVEWMAGEFDIDIQQQTPKRRLTMGHPNLSCMTPLQIATKLGDKEMFVTVIKQHAREKWSWGTVKQVHIDLKGIDSSGEGGNDVMELMVRLDAEHHTQELILDENMGGFIFHLYEDKWKQFGREAYHRMMLTHALYVAPLIFLSFWLKHEPVAELHDHNRKVPDYLAYWLCCIMFLRFAAEIDIAIKWRKNYKQDYWALWRWMCSFHFGWQLASYVFCSCALAIILFDIHSNADYTKRYLSDKAPHELIWFWLAGANFTGMFFISQLAFIPHRNLGGFVPAAACECGLLCRAPTLPAPALTPLSPRAHPALTPRSPRSHPALTPLSPRAHPALTPLSPTPAHPCPPQACSSSLSPACSRMMSPSS